MAIKASGEVISLKPLVKDVVGIGIVGKSPLITNKWSDRALMAMLDSHMQKTKAGRHEAKNPVADFEDSLYRLDDGGYGFPAAGFRVAIIEAARYFGNITMTSLYSGVNVLGEGPDNLVRITGDPEPRQDITRVGSGLNKKPDIRFRAMFKEWSADLRVEYLPSQITQEAVIALVDAAGLGGVGDWRPSKSKSGSFGTWEVRA